MRRVSLVEVFTLSLKKMKRIVFPRVSETGGRNRKRLLPKFSPSDKMSSSSHSPKDSALVFVAYEDVC